MQFENLSSYETMYSENDYPSIAAMMPDEIEIVFEYPENYDEEKESDTTVDSIWKELARSAAMTSTATTCTTPTGPLSTTSSADSTTSFEKQDRRNKVQPQVTLPTPPSKVKYSAYATSTYISTSSRQLYNQRFQYQRRIHTQHYLPPLPPPPPPKQQKQHRQEEVEQGRLEKEEKEKQKQPQQILEENDTSHRPEYNDDEELKTSPLTTLTNVQHQKEVNDSPQHDDKDEEELNRIPSKATLKCRQQQQYQGEQQPPRQTLTLPILEVGESLQQNRDKEEESKRRLAATTNIDLDYPFFETQTSWVEFQSNSIMWQTFSVQYEATSSRSCDLSSVSSHIGNSDSSSDMNIRDTIPLSGAVNPAPPRPPATTLSEVVIPVSRSFPLCHKTTTTTVIKSPKTGNKELDKQRNDTQHNGKGLLILKDDDRNSSTSRKPLYLYHSSRTNDTEEELPASDIFIRYNATDSGGGEGDHKLLVDDHRGCESFDKHDSQDFGDDNPSPSPRTQQQHSRTSKEEKTRSRRLKAVPQSLLSRFRAYHDCSASSNTASITSTTKRKKKMTPRNILPSSSRSMQTRLEAMKHQIISKPKKLISKPIRQSYLAVKKNMVPFACCVGSTGGTNRGSVDEDEGTMILIDRVYSDDNDDYIPPPATTAANREKIVANGEDFSPAIESFSSDMELLRSRVLVANQERPNFGEDGGVSVFDLLHTNAGVGRLNLDNNWGQTWQRAEF